MTPEVQRIVDDARQRLTAMVDDPPYRFVETTRRAAQAYQQQLKTFRGYSDTEIAAAETRLGVTFPDVFRGYLAAFGVAAGELFCGSDLATLDGFPQLQSAAEELLRESHVPHRLPPNAVVFLFHQGYEFAFIVADGGFDSPVFLYIEGDDNWSQWTSSLAEFIDVNIQQAEQNHRAFHDHGGYFVSIDHDGHASQIYPARADGNPPMGGPDRFID